MARILNTVAIVVALIFVVPWGLQWVRAPWSLAPLGPTLTGTWYGPLRARLGAEYRLFLSLEYQSRVNLRSNLTGRARICSQQGEIYEYALDGEASRSGDAITLGLAYVDPAQRALGNTLDGNWSGQTLTLSPRTNPFQPDGTFQVQRTVSTADPDDSFGPAELTRGDLASFLIACGRLSNR